MPFILELLKFLLPSLVLLALVYFLIKSFLKHEQHKADTDRKKHSDNLTIPIRLQAYERLILLLERFKTSGLIMRNNKPGMTAQDLHNALLLNIRDESEHNLSQQLYVSGQTWEMVKNAREETVKLINTTASKLDQEANATELSQNLLVADIDQSNQVIENALKFIKTEAQKELM